MKILIIIATSKNILAKVVLISKIFLLILARKSTKEYQIQKSLNACCVTAMCDDGMICDNSVQCRSTVCGGGPCFVTLELQEEERDGG